MVFFLPKIAVSDEKVVRKDDINNVLFYGLYLTLIVNEDMVVHY
jgi:hypothetical protein